MILSNIRFIGQFVEESNSLSEKLRTSQRHGDAREEFSAVGVGRGEREDEVKKGRGERVSLIVHTLLRTLII